MRRLIVALAVMAGFGLVVTGTGLAAGSATVKTHKGKLGTYLVDSKGRTLYMFTPDKTKKSTCTGECIAAWPALETTGKPKASGSAKASLLGTSKRSDDGKLQVTYKGHPLYYFANDKKAGDTKGEDLVDKWYVVSPSGKKIEPEDS